uniref:Uncharacterized protein n=1 Tax=Solanum tuberosum TaxID=4113 RepID=M1DF24_SOLTU
MLQSFEMETWEAHELQSLRAFIGVSELESLTLGELSSIGNKKSRLKRDHRLRFKNLKHGARRR